MRLYKNLDSKSKEELYRLLDFVKSHTELTPEEKEKNIELINERLETFIKREQILQNIFDGQSECSEPDNESFYEN